MLAVIITFAPIFLASVVFSQRFRNTKVSTMAFEANLLGAMISGILDTPRSLSVTDGSSS